MAQDYIDWEGKRRRERILLLFRLISSPGIITSGVHECGLDQIIEWIPDPTVVVNGGPSHYGVDADSLPSHRLYYRVCYWAVLILTGVQVQERDMRPIVGQEQRHDGLGDLRVRRPGSGECGKVFLVRSITVRTKLKG